MMSRAHGRQELPCNSWVGMNLYSKNCRVAIYQALKQTGLPFVKIKDLKPKCLQIISVSYMAGRSALKLEIGYCVP